MFQSVLNLPKDVFCRPATFGRNKSNGVKMHKEQANEHEHTFILYIERWITLG
jgi:hypothetical protein